MRHLDCSLTALAGLLIVGCGLGLLFGIDPWLLARIFALSMQIAAYVVISHRLSIMNRQGGRGL